MTLGANCSLNSLFCNKHLFHSVKEMMTLYRWMQLSQTILLLYTVNKIVNSLGKHFMKCFRTCIYYPDMRTTIFLKNHSRRFLQAHMI